MHIVLWPAIAIAWGICRKLLIVYDRAMMLAVVFGRPAFLLIATAAACAASWKIAAMVLLLGPVAGKLFLLLLPESSRLRYEVNLHAFQFYIQHERDSR